MVSVGGKQFKLYTSLQNASTCNACVHAGVRRPFYEPFNPLNAKPVFEIEASMHVDYNICTDI